MLSDTLFDTLSVACKDIARYAFTGEIDGDWYDQDTYDAIVKSLAVVQDKQIKLDAGADPTEAPDEEQLQYCEWRVYEMIFDFMAEFAEKE